MSENQENSNSSERLDPAAEDEQPSRLSKIIFIIICTMLVFPVIAFGAVDTWALGVLTLFLGLMTVLWLADAWQLKEFRFNTNRLQIPLLGLILIGLIQLLPLRRLDIPSDLLSISEAVLAVDKNKTRRRKI